MSIKFCLNHVKKGFTLAEVLITLGIVGIVAAMTMPTLIQKYKSYVREQEFKTAYSIVSQALLKSEADLEYSPDCFYRTKDGSISATGGYSFLGADRKDCQLLTGVMFKNLNVIKVCENKAYDKGCIPKYIGLEKIFMQRDPDLTEEDAMDLTSQVTVWRTNNILNRNPAYVFKDGIIVLFAEGWGFSNFALDINGKKGPNKWGYDLFSFLTVKNNDNNLVIIGRDNFFEKGGKSTPQMIKNIYAK